MSESCVYVQDKNHGWLPAHVLKNHDGGSVQVRVFSVDECETLGDRTVSLKDYPLQQLPFQNVDASGKLMEMADMVDLPSLHEVSRTLQTMTTWCQLEVAHDCSFYPLGCYSLQLAI